MKERRMIEVTRAEIDNAVWAMVAEAAGVAKLNCVAIRYQYDMGGERPEVLSAVIEVAAVTP